MACMLPRTKTLTVIIGNCSTSMIIDTIYPTLLNSTTRQIMQMLPNIEKTPAKEANRIWVPANDTKPCVVEALIVRKAAMA